MATTVQKQLLKLALIVSPTTKNGQVFNDASAALTITGATNATPIVLTFSANHGLKNNDSLYVSSVDGNTAANNTLANPNWTITRISANQVSLNGSSGNGAYTSGGTAVPALIGSVDAAAVTKQRFLDVYNQSRYALFNAMKNSMTRAQLSESVGALVVSISNFSFTLASTVSTATKPSGYIDFIGLSNASDVPIFLIKDDFINDVREGSNLDFKQSATNMFVFDVGQQFVSYGTTGVNSGNSFLTTAATYKLIYYGISDFTLTDVLGNTTTETYNEQYHPLLIELAEAIFDEQGTVQINALATKLLGK